MTITLIVLLTYLAVGYFFYVPRAVQAETERLIADWDKEAERVADSQRYTITLTSHRISWIPPRVGVDEEGRARYQERRRRDEERLQERLDAIRPAPAPVDRLRRQAARRWPAYCLTWLPIVALGLALRGFDAITNHAASRTPRTSQEIAAQAGLLTARIAELEKADREWRRTHGEAS